MRSVWALAVAVALIVAACSFGPSPWEEHGEGLFSDFDIPRQIDVETVIDAYNSWYPFVAGRASAPTDCADNYESSTNRASTLAFWLQNGSWDLAANDMGKLMAYLSWMNQNGCPQVNN